MRRKRTSCFRPNIFARGVTVSVMARNRRIQSPVACSRYWVGFAPHPLGPCQARMAIGTRQSANTTTFVHLFIRMRFIGWILVVFFQVHAIVQTSDLISVTVEHLCGRILEKSRQANFPGLAPAWVVHLWIHIGIEAILVCVGDVPGC